MRKRTPLILILSAIMMLSVKPSPAATMPPDPELGPAWLMVSFSCAVDTATLQERYAGTIQAFAWNGESYAAVDHLEPGRGYFVNYDFDIAPIAVCPGGGDGVTQLILAQGWNLIGNPLDRAVAFNDFQAADGSVPFGKIFSLVNNTFVSMSPDQNAQPGVAYWVYVPDAATVTVNNQWEWTDIQITPQKSYSYEGLPASCLKSEEFINGSLYPLSHPAQFHASAITGIVPGAHSDDVTAQIDWNSLNPDVATVDMGLLTPLSTGWVTLEVKIKGETKTNFKIFIFDDAAPVCVAITPAGEMDIAPLESVSLQAFSYTIDFESCDTDNVCKSKAEEITGQAEWEMDNADTGVINGNVFTAGKTPATVSIHAQHNKRISNSVVINIRKLNIRSILMDITGISAMPYQCTYKNEASGFYYMLTGSELPIKVTGYEKINSSGNSDSGYSGYYDSDTESSSGAGTVLSYDLSRIVRYTVSDPSVAEIVNGSLHALKPGIVTISAIYDHFMAVTYNISVLDQGLPLCLILSPKNGATIPPQGAVTVSASGLFPKDDVHCKSARVTSGYCSTDMTDKVQWAISNPSQLTVTGNTAAAEESMGTVELRATYKGLPSNTISIKIKNVSWMIVSATMNASKLSSCPFQGEYSGCFATSPGMTHVLTAMARKDSSRLATPQNVTAMTRWEVSDTSVAEVDAAGNLKAKSQGLIWIRANVGDARSDKIWLAVNDKSGYEFLITGPAYNSGFKPLKPLQVGSTMPLIAILYKYSSSNSNAGCSNCAANYTATYVTDKVQWETSASDLGSVSHSSSSNCLSSCPTSTYFIGKAPGLIDVSARYNSIKSNAFTIDVWDFQNISYCDKDNINKGDWSDPYSSAELETDCNVYSRGEPVSLRYSAYIKDRIYLDNCLDMYVMDDKDNIVCTLREQGCTSEKIGRVSAKTANPVYQYVDTCDMKDKSGNPVPAGTYFAVARFYIMWEPVIRVPFRVVE